MNRTNEHCDVTSWVKMPNTHLRMHRDLNGKFLEPPSSTPEIILYKVKNNLRTQAWYE